MIYRVQDIVSIKSTKEDTHILHIRKKEREPIQFTPGTIRSLYGDGTGSRIIEHEYLADFFSPEFTFTIYAEKYTAVLFEMRPGEELIDLNYGDVQSQIFYTETGGLVYGFYVPAGSNFHIYGKKTETNKTYRKIKANARDSLIRQKIVEEIKLDKKPNGYQDDDFLTKQELADYLGLAKGTISNRISRGQAPKVTKVGNNVRFKFQDVKNWMEKQRNRY